MRAASLKHYGQALAQYSADQALFDQLITDLVDVAEKINQSWELKNYLSDQHVAAAKKREALKSVFQDFISQKTYNFLFLLIRNKKIKELDRIIELAKKQHLVDREVHDVIIESAAAITAEQENSIRKILEKKLDQQVITRNVINRELTGGLRITIGDIVVDGSLRGRFERLKQKISELE